MFPVAYKPITLDLLEPYKALRLRALREDPAAFGAIYADEAAFDGETWAGRCRTMEAGLKGCGWIAFLNKSPVGLIGIFDFGEPGEVGDEVMIVSMWVAPEARRRGVASELIGRALAWARTRPETTRVTLEVMETNLPARRGGFFIKQQNKPPGCPVTK